MEHLEEESDRFGAGVVAALVRRVLLQIVNVDCGQARHEQFQFPVVEDFQQVGRHNTAKSFHKGLDLRAYLPIQPIIGHLGDIVKFILIRDQSIGPILTQLDILRLAEVVERFYEICPDILYVIVVQEPLL